MIQKYPFKNLVFKGGGMKALAYHGAIRVLEEEKILEQIERVAGTSAGALLATLISLGMSVNEIIAFYQSVDYARIAGVRSNLKPRPGDRNARFYERDLNRFLNGIDSITRLIQHFGWYDNCYAQELIENTIAEQCRGNGRATFADFQKLGLRDLYVVTTNITKHRIQYFSAEETPDAAVADAVVMSSSLPFYFEAIQFDGKSFGSGDYYADGGLLYNYPLHIFDAPHFEARNPNYLYGINWETLGCRLYTPEDSPVVDHEITNLFGYIENLLETIVEVQDLTFENKRVDQMRTINISNCGVSATDLQLFPDSNNPKYQEMVAAGEKAAHQYLASYRLPIDRWYDVKARLADFLDEHF